MRFVLLAASAVPALVLSLSPATADEISAALDHAPIGVMGDHRHANGEVMLSYRAMVMQMAGNRDGTDTLSPEEIVTEVANPFAPPATLRVVPTEMTMTMHMVGAMYAPSDRVTLMLMGTYLTSEMDHTTFQGMAGTTELGTFTTETSGFGDTTVAALIGVYDKEHLTAHLGLGISLPTGSIEETDTILTPMNTTPSPRLPYPMQLGSGTYDFKPSFTVWNKTHDAIFGGGAQISGVIRMDENNEGYRLGDRAEATAWAAFAPDPRLSFSLRGRIWSQGRIDGTDPLIAAPVQTADPDNHGGSGMDVGLGANLLATEGTLRGHRLALEVLLPIHRDLNGPQLETDWTVNLGWQKAF